MTDDEEQAARITGAVWQAVWLSGGPGVRTLRHFGAAWLARLALTSAGALPPGQPVAMLDITRRTFERHIGAAAMRAYEHRSRTRVYEDIGWGDDRTWAGLAGRHLSRLVGGPRVTVSVYESAPGDEGFGTHRYAWLGIIV
jgi:hypothetical protein